MLGRYVSDLEVGDELGPVTYEMTPFVVREYCRGVGEDAEIYHSAAASPTGIQQAPPTLVHVDKLRLFRHSCPEGPGPNARIHVEFHSRNHQPVNVGEQLTATGRVSDRYQKRGRTYLEIAVELRSAADRRLLISYADTAVLAYESAETP